ncbi:MAG: hypothetical protein ACRC8M_07325 [Cetobacterium sp.]|uniref:hypothetical protein n=1 Tax=Cetobacterium sp. TaxID=2071632 RepID=UPI003F3BA7E2
MVRKILSVVIPRFPDGTPIRTIVNIVEKNKEINFGYSLTKYGDPYEVKDDVIFRKMLEENKL